MEQHKRLMNDLEEYLAAVCGSREVSVVSAVIVARIGGVLMRGRLTDCGWLPVGTWQGASKANPADADILTALRAGKPLKGEAIARHTGRPYTPYLRSRLSSLRKSGRIRLTPDGYVVS